MWANMNTMVWECFFDAEEYNPAQMLNSPLDTRWTPPLRVKRAGACLLESVSSTGMQLFMDSANSSLAEDNLHSTPLRQVNLLGSVLRTTSGIVKTGAKTGGAVWTPETQGVVLISDSEGDVGVYDAEV